MNDELRRNRETHQKEGPASDSPAVDENPAADSEQARVTVDDFAAPGEFNVVEHAIAPVPPEVAYPALRNLDMLTVRTPMTTVVTWVRALPERLQQRVPPRIPTRLTFDDRVASGQWVRLGERPGREVIYGAAGRFWAPVVRWDPLTSGDEFIRYDRPRHCKVVLSLSVRPYGRGRSLLSYDIRTRVTDPTSQRMFRLYWRTVAPFVKRIMRDTLRTASEQARHPRMS